MKKIALILALIMALGMIPAMGEDALAGLPLDSDENIRAAMDAVYEEYLSSIQDRKNELAEGQITLRDITMRVYTEVIGEPDENGYPLYICLHGGGYSPTPDMNNSQWEHMKVYYKSAVEYGVYIAPRGIRDTSNTHSNPESYAFFDRIIENSIAFYNVDPNRVYLMGFSAGGDGVYQLSPRMADRFAAANMSAGSPSMVSLVNLYNLPFYLQVGSMDTAYDRNILTAEYDGKLNALAEKYGGYPHKTFIHMFKPHNFLDNGRPKQIVFKDVQAWLKNGDERSHLQDTNAVRLTNAHTRNPLPERVVWEVNMHAPVRNTNCFYWLGRGKKIVNYGTIVDLRMGTVVAHYDKAENKIVVEECTKSGGLLQIYFHPDMVDFSAPVTIDFRGTVYTLDLEPSLEVMRNTAAQRGDPYHIFCAMVEIDVHDSSLFSVNYQKMAE